MKTTSINLGVVANSTPASLSDKQVKALNGFDSLIRTGAKFLILSGFVATEKAISQVTKTRYDRDFVWVIDREKGLKKVNRTSLVGGIGYLKANTIPGVWHLNQEGTWYTLQPAEDDAATRETFTSWGISKILPESFVIQEDDEGKKRTMIPNVMMIEITKTGYVASHSPISKEDYMKKPSLQDDKLLKPFSQFYWEGTGVYATPAEVDEFIAAVSERFPTQMADLESYKATLFHTV